MVAVGLLLCLMGCGDTPLPAPADMGRDLVLVFPAGCSNGARDGNETDIDCGGDACPKCGSGKACLHGTDCDSTICDNNVCAGPSCTDKLLNGSETDVDCGGGCPGCAVGQKCLRSGDCASGNCVNNTCQPGACMNNMKDGMETDLDCGGPTCPACADGKTCLMASDCQVMRCVNNVCQGVINCNPPMANCDGNPQSGCNVNLNTDAKNCGKCGMVCPMNAPSCMMGKCTGLYAPSGVQTNVPIAQLVGWQQCYLGNYTDNGIDGIAFVIQGCSKNKMMLACRPKGSNVLSVLAWAPKVDVVFDTGAMNMNMTHVANGVGWYFNNTRSWGFAPAGDPVTLNVCDTAVNPNNGLRLCWTMGGRFGAPSGTIAAGYRCGADTSNTGWERLVFQAD